jgi:hypothetical protein
MWIVTSGTKMEQQYLAPQAQVIPFHPLLQETLVRIIVN